MKFHFFSPSKVVKYLILSDLAFWTGWGLLNPVFAIFVVDKIKGGNALVVGISAAIFWIVRAVFRVPIGILLDGKSDERDDYFCLVMGLSIASLVPLGFIFAYLPWHIYLLQALHGVGLAMGFAGWMAIFTRHIGKGKESTEWGIEETFLSVGTGLAGVVGGWAVTRFGFVPVFIAVTVLGLVGTAILFGLRNEIKGVFDHGLRISLKDIFTRPPQQ